MINIELISPTKNAAVVRSVNGKTGEVIIEIPSIEGLATEQYVQAAIEAIDVDMTGVATEEYVAKKIAEAQLAGGDVDLSAYYTKTETDAKIDEKIAAIEIPTPEAPEIDLSGYVTVEYMENEFAPAVNEILESKADIAYVDNAIAEALGGGEEHNVLYAVEEELVPVEGMFTLPNWMPLGEEYAYQPLTLEAHIRATIVESGEVVEDWMAQEAVYDAEVGVIVITDGDPLINPPEINNETGAFAAGHIFYDPSVADVVITRVALVSGAPEYEEPTFVPDNATIIDEGGVLRTAIGGFYTEPQEKEVLVSMVIEEGARVENDGTYDYVQLAPFDINALMEVDPRVFEIDMEVDGERGFRQNDAGLWFDIWDQGDGPVAFLGNIQWIGEWGREVFLTPEGKLYSEKLPESLVIYQFDICQGERAGISPIQNEFIDTNYIATVDYVNQAINELGMRIEALEQTPNAEEGMF